MNKLTAFYRQKIFRPFSSRNKRQKIFIKIKKPEEKYFFKNSRD